MRLEQVLFAAALIVIAALVVATLDERAERAATSNHERTLP